MDVCNGLSIEGCVVGSVMVEQLYVLTVLGQGKREREREREIVSGLDNDINIR